MKKIILILVLAGLSVAAISANPVVEMKTTMGNIEVELLKKDAPISVKNFLKYVEAKKYDGTVFHRVISNFMIQGGGFTTSMDKVSGFAPIKNEAKNGISNTEGTLAMARTNDVNSATNQFFINVKDNNFLNHSGQNYGYAVFGRIVKGMSTVNRIKKVRTGNKGGYQNVPLLPVVINSIRVKK